MTLIARLLCIFLMSSCALSQSIKKQPWTLTAYFENDLFNNTDESYTNGVRLSWISPDVSSYEDDKRLPKVIRKVNDRLRFFHDMNLRNCADKEENSTSCLQRNLVISIGQLMFTPEDYEARELIEDDRPYAGSLYMTFGYHIRDDTQLDTIEVSLGVVGPASLAKETQDAIHKLRGIPRFQGWDNQLRNEPVFQMLYEHKNRFDLGQIVVPWGGPNWYPRHDFITHIGANLGNALIYANAGFEYRLGLGLPDDFGSAALRPGGDNSAPGRRDSRTGANGGFVPTRKDTSLHLFASFDGRLVGRDIFLDGNTFRDSHSVSKKRAVGDISLGIGLIYHRWKASLAQVWRSKEFDDQNDPHEFVSISLSYSY